MSRKRESPEKFLARAQEEERQEERGKLKIYLGAAPGVGKTYTMLQDALAKRAQGLDVVIGVVESHGREDIKSMIKDFETIPRQKINYRGQSLLEFDLDAALKRNPGLILMDEMAHTNVPTVRHKKRWQDIKELLDRGIDVYTTLNVQHIESLNNIVSQIVNARIKETVPDFMLERAEIIELIDLPPEDLLKRLHEGKVYFPAQAEIAADHFFRKGNLFALRELALRVTAERVSAQVLLYRQGQGIRHIWPTKDKLLVCIGANGETTKLIRAARRLATKLKAEWIAIHIQIPGSQLSKEHQKNVIESLRLAEQLGADTHIWTGFDIVKEVMNFAREQNVTQIVIGKKVRPRWHHLFFKSLADELIRQSEEIDVYVITGEFRAIKAPAPFTISKKIAWHIYGIAIGIVALATLVNIFLYPFLTANTLALSTFIMVYLLGIIIVSLFGRIGPAILATFLSVFIYGHFFIRPHLTMAISDVEYFFTLLVMLFVAYTISYLTIRMRLQAEDARVSEKRMTTLHTLSRKLASTRGIHKLLTKAISYIGEVFSSQILALLGDDGQLKVIARFHADGELSEKERGVAQWAFDLGQVAGKGTDTLPFSDALYVPLLTAKGAIGVLRIYPSDPNVEFTPEQMNVLEACANQVALAIEVDRLQEQAKKSELQIETDHVRSSLLQTLSHDLRLPLVTVRYAARLVVKIGNELKDERIKKTGRDILHELEQLNRLVNNILQITYLEAESIKLQKETRSLQDLIEAVIKDTNERIEKRPVQVHFEPNLPKVLFDYALMHEVIINLLDNAIKFTEADTPIDISVESKDDKILVSVADRGPGIGRDEVEKLFEKYYRGHTTIAESGLGLGLAICHIIIKAHGGEIWAENRAGGGAIFRFSLPTMAA